MKSKKIYYSADFSSKHDRKKALNFVGSVEGLGYEVVNKDLITTPDFFKSLMAMKNAEMLVADVGDGNINSVNLDIGMAVGWNESIVDLNIGYPKKILAYTSNLEVLEPKSYTRENGELNVSTVGLPQKMLDTLFRWGGLMGDEDGMLKELERDHVFVVIKEWDDMITSTPNGTNVTGAGLELGDHLFTNEMRKYSGSMISVSLDESGEVRMGDDLFTKDMYKIVPKDEDSE